MKYFYFLVSLLILSTLACGSQEKETTSSRPSSGVNVSSNAGRTTPTPTKARTPATTDKPTAEINVIEDVAGRGGIEVFPEPSRQSGRIFAAVSDFKPYAAGKNEDGEWIFILYFDGDLQSGWTPQNELVLTDTQLNHLKVIDPDDLPTLPDLAYNEQAARPYGVSDNAPKPTAALVQQEQPTQAQAVQQPASQAAPPTVQQAFPTSPPQPTRFSCPRNCDGAVSMGLSAQQAASCPGLDRDHDGVACYGD